MHRPHDPLNVMQETNRDALEHQILQLQQDLTALQKMITGDPDALKWDPYTFRVWTSGTVAGRVAEIVGVLSRQRTLYEVQARLKKAMQIDSEQPPASGKE